MSKEHKEGDRVVGYSVKYALTRGIRLGEARRILNAPEYVDFLGSTHKIGNDFFLTFDEAENAAKTLINRKLRSLERQMVRLRYLLDASWDEL